ncbi:MAG: serine/threonine-protein kinase [Planctomycetota bacterium]|nr:serine/threonine-protein kinase [Planctomycetota bacterium]MDA1114083.1 serine/threonine-protein kinase [Planctomycetota bacterium]
MRHIRRLGESPLSLVFLVEDDQAKQYALKILRPSVAKDKRILERWRREGELLQEFAHPNLVRCYGTPEVEGRPSILLEFVDGLSLRERLRNGPLGWEEAARYGVQIARALQYLHKHGAIHRDVKPHNVLIDTQRGAILADLGLVRRDEDPTMTRQGAALGSPAYMSPEQARDPSDVDEQADIYSLGATLFHTLSGKPPFLGAGVGEVIHRVMHEEPESLPETVSPAFAKVVLTAMAKDPERRYARARDFGSDMGRVLLGYPPRLLTRYRRRRQLRTLSMGGGALVLLGLMFWVEPWNFGAEKEAQGSELLVEETDKPIVAPPSLGWKGVLERQPIPPEILAATFFRAWHTPYDQRFRKALNASQYREALAECASMLHAKVPKDAPIGFLDLRQGWVSRSKIEVTAGAEKAAGRAFDLLSSQTVFAQEAIQRGDFDGDIWSASVLDQWRRAGLRMADFPLHPGSPDPVGRLQMAQVQLENEADQVRIRKALESVAAVRQNTAQLLRAGSFDEARRRWDRVDPVVYLRSEDARADLARIEELLALDRRLQSRFREKVGQTVELRLHSGVLIRGQLFAKESGSGYAVDYRGQTQVDVNLLGLEANFVVTWLLGREEVWLAAQVLWCQNDLNLAIAAMRPLADMDVAEEWRPQYWSEQWELERVNGGLAETGFAEEGLTSQSGAQAVVQASGPQAELMDALQKRLPDAKLTQQGLSVILDLGDLQVDGTWSLDLRQELRGWELTSWRLVWQVGQRETAPTRLLWLDDILLTKTGKAPPQMTIAGRRFPGYGMAPGLGLQVLDWNGQMLLLDGIPVSKWQPESTRLARFFAVCETGFRFNKVSLRFSPR